MRYAYVNQGIVRIQFFLFFYIHEFQMPPNLKTKQNKIRCGEFYNTKLENFLDLQTYKQN